MSSTPRMSSPHDPEAQTGTDESHPEYTNEKWLGGPDNPKTQSSAENYGDPSSKLWSMYLTKAEKEDEQITKNWFEDTGGVLVFNGLLSTIVATFLTLSVPQLMPNSGNQTVALLTQLVNISSGAPLVVQNTPFKAPASIVRVNMMWFLSLILSLCCALLTTSMQQSARVYLDYAQHRDAPRKQARIREYMFEGVEEFRLSQAVGTMPFLLHLSVFLFFAGLIDFLLPINTVVAFSALGLIAFCASIYAILTLLPIFHPNCPYRTPLSGFTYFSYHFSVSGLLSVVKIIEGMFHRLLLGFWRCSHPHISGSPDHGPIKWKNVLEQKVHSHYKRFLHGLQRRVVLSAMEAPSRVDARALYWTLTTLGEDKEFEEFAARMPGFFDSSADPDATSAMLSLMYEKPTFDPILGSRLRELLGSCRPGVSPLAEEQRDNRLRVCLTSLWYCLRAYNLPENLEEPLAPYVRAIFASPDVITWIQTEEDLATRLLGRCFGSLVVKKLASDIASPARAGIPPTIAEIACLKTILGTTGEQVRAWLDRNRAIDVANIVSLISGEFETLVTSVTVTNGDVVDVCQQTLRILAEGIFSSQSHVDWDIPQVEQFHHIYFKSTNAPVPDVLKEQLRYVLDRLPPISYVEESEMVMPIPEPVSEVTPSSPQILYPALGVRDTVEPPLSHTPDSP